MSGVGEAGLVLGLISSIITIFEATHEIYEAATEANGLPKKLRVVAEQIPLVYNALGLAENNLRANRVTQEAVLSTKPVLEQCKDNAAKVKDIFEQTLPAQNASRAERLKKAVGLKIKSTKAKEYMEQVVESMDLLAQQQVFQDAETLEEIKAAMDQLTSVSDEEEPPPRFIHSGAGAINANTGEGTQKNYNNSGSGSIYNAEKQFFGREQDPVKVLAIAGGAAFDDVGRDHAPFCLPDTRTDVLRDIRSWLDNKSAEHIYWLSGWAGTGKSTIARTIAQEYRDMEWQLGNFFFSRGGGDAGHIHKFTATLAMQLSQRWPAFKRALQKAIAADEGIVRRTQEAQWAALILKPLADVLMKSSPQRVLFVIDAVDECGIDIDMSHIIKLLLAAQDVHHSAFRIFVTSRPEVTIRHQFDRNKDQHIGLALHHISDSIVQHDLEIFLRFHLVEIRQLRGLSAGWPGDTNIHGLVAMSASLFIWAATVTRFIAKGGALAEKRLSLVLDRGHHPGGPEMALDKIYLMVLESTISGGLSDEEKKEWSYDLRYVLGTIATVFAPLSPIGLARLLNLTTDKIEGNLADLHSILDIPSDTDDAIRLHHPSFRDFLYDHSRCRNNFFYIEQAVMHRILAKRCINIISILRKNICHVDSAGTLVKDIPPAALAQHLPSEVQYSCRYWLDHIKYSPLDLVDGGLIHHFLRASCAYWLEAMSLMGRVTEAISMMIKLQGLIDEKIAPQLQALVCDTLRFLHTFSHVLNQAPLQLYSAGLHFSPSRSTFRNFFGVHASTEIEVVTQLPDQWDACLQVLEDDIDAVTSVAFSPDGSRLASGIGDGMVRVVDVETGQSQCRLEGHSDTVTSVVFSPDGSRLVSGSYDGTVRVWDIETGQWQRTLEGHSDTVTSVVFLLDGSRIASSSSDKTVRVWDLETGKCQRLALGSDGQTVLLWDVETGQCQRTLKGHSHINSVTSSPDGSRLALGSDNGTVRVWDVKTGQSQGMLEGHSGEINSVVFSPDALQVASGSKDGSVRVWDAETGQCQLTVEGHSEGVNCVTFSRGGSRLVSGSDDGTLRVWDVETGQSQRRPYGHSGGVTCVVFSRDGSRLASGSDDGMVQLWAVETGQCQRRLLGHSECINSVVFSPNESRLASASNDRTVRVWDVKTGQCQCTLKGHTSWVVSVVFSPNGSRVASSSWDKTSRVWNLVSSAEIFHCDASYDAVVEFSDDGSQLVVDGKTLSLPPPTPLSTIVARSHGHLTNINTSKFRINHDWLAWSDQRILWLPPDYRPGKWESYGSTIVIGSGTGRVTFVQVLQHPLGNQRNGNIDSGLSIPQKIMLATNHTKTFMTL